MNRIALQYFPGYAKISVICLVDQCCKQLVEALDLSFQTNLTVINICFNWESKTGVELSEMYDGSAFLDSTENAQLLFEEMNKILKCMNLTSHSLTLAYHGLLNLPSLELICC